MNPLYIGIDVSSVAYLMKPDGSKHSSFSVRNNLGGAKLMSERIVLALGSMQLTGGVSKGGNAPFGHTTLRSKV